MAKMYGIVVGSRNYNDEKTGTQKAAIEVLVQNEAGLIGILKQYTNDPNSAYVKSLPLGSVAQCEVEAAQKGLTSFLNLVSVVPCDKKAVLTIK